MQLYSSAGSNINPELCFKISTWCKRLRGDEIHIVIWLFLCKWNLFAITEQKKKTLLRSIASWCHLCFYRNIQNMSLCSLWSGTRCVFACAAVCLKASKVSIRQSEREGESRLILIAALTVSVGFSTLHSTRYKGKSGGEVRKRHSILIYCPTTVSLTTLSTMLLSVGHFEPWINTHLPLRAGSVLYKRQRCGNFTLQLFYEMDNHFIWWIWLCFWTLHK